MYRSIKKGLKNKDIILVDFFDTVMFRRVHPYQLLDQWAICMIRKFPSLYSLGEEDLVEKRHKAHSICKKTKEEPTYNDIMNTLFNLLTKFNLGDVEEFIATSHSIEIALERGCQFPNKRMVDFLLDARKRGKKVYCVSDFHLSQKDLTEFALSSNILDCFDFIFVSSEFNKCKSTGDLYPAVLSELGVTNEQVIMIGDNKISDGMNAQEHGIESYVLPHYFQRGKNQISRRFNVNYSKKYIKKTIRSCYKNRQPFSEYINLFYVFTSRLSTKLHEKEVNHVTFLAREGYYLRELFERYRYLTTPKENYIDTSYLKCSRRSIRTVKAHDLDENAYGEISIGNWFKAVGLSIEEVATSIDLSELDVETANLLGESKDYQKLRNDQTFNDLLHFRLMESKTAFMDYLKEFNFSRSIHMVDVGWKGTMQQGIEQISGVPTEGYYLGVIGNPDEKHPIKRNGLIFSDNEGKSQCYDILRSNTQLYEQLLSAPHGSAQKYKQNHNGEVTVEEEWVDNEKSLYYEFIHNIQTDMTRIFDSLCVWNTKEDHGEWTKQLARMVLRSSLFADRKRLQFLLELDKGFLSNFGQESKGLNFDSSYVKVNILELLTNPAAYTRYFAKVQRLTVNNKLLSILYYPCALFFYSYVNFTLLFSKRKTSKHQKQLDRESPRNLSAHT